MKDKKLLSRRRFIPLAGAGALLPFVGVSAPATDRENGEFAVLLTSEGKAVRVRNSALQKANVLKEKVSNKSLFNWLKKKS